jgi:hypothetical protein
LKTLAIRHAAERGHADHGRLDGDDTLSSATDYAPT